MTDPFLKQLADRERAKAREARASRTAHCIVDTSTGETVFRCLHCGESYTPALPVPLRLMTAMCQAWVADHRRCAKPKEAQMSNAKVRE